ncbi:hypothetical protein [Bradyrhizobium japonicum]|uniref:hypothetical protein n=1 Tax=Bradyrhizobium japonicum TaxID=375 RepID=UPI00201201AF|nr:hypothetical protein [Bradyrhizobium japonicum]
MDKSLTSAPLRALEEAFHAMRARSRDEPAPDLAQRLDRLARLRSVVADKSWMTPHRVAIAPGSTASPISIRPMAARSRGWRS